MNANEPRKPLIALCLLLVASSGTALAADGAIPLWEPTVITQPGSYVVTRDIASSGGPVLDIQVGGVSIALNGHTLSVGGTTNPVIKISSVMGVDPQPFRIADGTILGGAYGIRAIDSGECRWLRLDGLTVKGASESAVRIDHVDEFEARGIIVAGTKVGFDLLGTSGRSLALLAGNTITADVGVRCTGVNCMVTDSAISSCVTAVHLVDAAGSQVSHVMGLSPGDGVCFNPQPEPPGSGLRIEASPGTVVSYSTFLGAPTSTGANHGIVADATSDGVNITDNWVRGFGDDGVRILGRDATAHCNQVTGNGGHGIYLGGFNDLADGNKVGGNGGDGVHFATSDHVFQGNVLRNNGMPVGGAGLSDSIDGGGNIQ